MCRFQFAHPIYMNHRISNSFLAIEVKEAGAELCSFFDVPHNLELLWQADEAWPRHSPTLFPMVGGLAGDQYQVDGQTYTMGRHGFARDVDFDLTEQSDQHLVFSLSHSDSTLAMYPFQFRFSISYFLIGPHLRITFTIENPDSAPLWFSAGAHPAFKCPVLPAESYDDYDLIFEKPETKDTHLLAEDGTFDGRKAPLLQNQTVLPVTHELFANDALVFHQLESNWVALQSRKSGKGVKLHSPDWPYYGIWAKTNGDFVCLEPWYGRADDSDTDGDWTKKPGIIRLEGGSKWSAHYEVEAL